MKRLNKEQKMTIQLWLGVCLAAMGILLLWASFIVPPLGIIHSSVLTGVGEVFTFSGALIGIDYTYKYNYIKFTRNYRNKGYDKEREEDTDSEN